MNDFLSILNEELELRGYSKCTKRAYTQCVVRFLVFVSKKANIAQIGFESLGGIFWNEAVREYLLGMIADGKSGQTVNLSLGAMRFFLRMVVKVEPDLNLRFQRKAKTLPIAITRQEVMSILRVLINRKHSLIVALGYGSGLRVSEVANLKVKDLDFPRGMITVRAGKGGKDRITIFPERFKVQLYEFIDDKSKDDYLFISERGRKMSARTIQKVFSVATEKAGISKPITFHSLRHGFATQLLENGVDIRYIQELLGHSSIKTTLIYTRVSPQAIRRISSPL